MHFLRKLEDFLLPPKSKKWEHQVLLEYSTDYFDFLHLLFAGGGNGGALVRALASHQFGLGSYPGVDALCGMSLLMVLSPALRGFLVRISILLKHQHFQFDQEW